MLCRLRSERTERIIVVPLVFLSLLLVWAHHPPVVRAGGEPPIPLDSGCLPLAAGSIADVATNLSLNLVNEELRTCGRNNTVNRDLLGYVRAILSGD